MYKNRFLSSIAMVSLVVLFATCNKSSDDSNNGPYFAANIDMTTSSLADDRVHTTLYYSVDNGTTWSEGQVLNPGTKFKVKVFNKTQGIFLDNANFFTLDWTGSSPKPSSASSDSPDFTMQGSNTLVVKVTDTFCAYTANSWTGDWLGVENPGTTDANTIRNDASKPDSLIMDNWWGDGVDVYMLFSPSTSPSNQWISVPEQTTAENGVASGSGSYNQCTGKFELDASYKIGGTTYLFTYSFHRP